MTHKLLCLFFFSCLIPPVFVFSQNPIDQETGMMTEEQALSLLLSKRDNATDAGLVVIHKIEPDANSREVAEKALADARAKKVDLYEDGVLAHLLRIGGYVVLEFNKRSDLATRIHLVTMDEAGKPLTESEDVDGKLSKSDALMLIKKNEEFSEAFFNSPYSNMKELLLRFGGTGIATSTDSDLRGCMDIPERVMKLTTQLDEQMDLLSLPCGMELFFMRYALAQRTFSTDLGGAFERASQELSKLHDESQTGRLTRSDLDEFLNLDSINTHNDLITRIEEWRQFNAFLDNRLSGDLDSVTYKANLVLSTVPVQVGGQGEPSFTYFIITGTYLISGWSRAENGEFVLTGFTIPPD